jgi:hypothetical protein
MVTWVNIRLRWTGRDIGTIRHVAVVALPIYLKVWDLEKEGYARYLEIYGGMAVVLHNYCYILSCRPS